MHARTLPTPVLFARKRGTSPAQVTSLVAYGLPHEVFLEWDASPSPGVTGYVVQQRPVGVSAWDTVATLVLADLANAAAPTLLLTKLLRPPASSRRWIPVPLFANTDYEFRVAAVAGEQGPFSALSTTRPDWPAGRGVEVGAFCTQGTDAARFYSHAAFDVTGVAATEVSIGEGTLTAGASYTGEGIAFDGVAGAVNGVAGGELPAGGTATTEYFLLKFTTAVGGKRVRKTASAARYELRTGGGGTLLVRSVLGSTVDLTLTGTIPLGEWILVWFRRSGAEMRGKLGANAEASINTLPAATVETANQVLSFGDATASQFTLGAYVRVNAAVADHTPYINLFTALGKKRGITIQGI